METTMDRTQIRNAFVWAYQNGHEKLIESFLHDVEMLVYDSLILEGNTKPHYWYTRLLYASEKILKINTLYKEEKGKCFARFCCVSKHYDMSNFVREVALALIPGNYHKYAEDVPPNFPYHKGNTRPSKQKIRSALAWLKANGEDQVVRYTLLYIRRTVDTAISMNYPSSLEKKTDNIKRVCARIHWAKKKLRAVGFKEFYFRKVFFEEQGNKDMKRFVEEIAGALIWDYERPSPNFVLQNQQSTLSMSETIWHSEQILTSSPQDSQIELPGSME